MSASPETVIVWESPEPCMAVACAKCRELAVFEGAEKASKAAVHHVKECGSETVMIVELIPPSQAFVS